MVNTCISKKKNLTHRRLGESNRCEERNNCDRFEHFGGLIVNECTGWGADDDDEEGERGNDGRTNPAKCRS